MKQPKPVRAWAVVVAGEIDISRIFYSENAAIKWTSLRVEPKPVRVLITPIPKKRD